jgi:glyoxylase-like metal-dependent hydrolase (beta-lactamase superfamily II)
MTRILKRSLLALGIATGIVALGIAGLFVWTFAGRMPIADGVDFGPARIVKDGFVSLAVVDIGNHEVALVDAGNDPSAEGILAELVRRGLGSDAVKLILLTHGHADHVAGIPRFPNAQVVALAAESDLVAGLEGGHGPLTRMVPVHATGLRVTRPVNDGDTIALGNLQARVFAVPGHTAGCAAWLVGDVLFLGDSADAASDGRLVGAPFLFSDDTALNRASLVGLAGRLAELGAPVRAIVFSHSGALTGGLEPLARFANLP